MKEAVVYGVAVANADGKAGMAALTIDGEPDLDAIAARRKRPAPLRAAAVPAAPPALEATATFKPMKRTLAAEGFDPAKVADPLYVYDADLDRYVPLDLARLAAIRDGSTRL